MSCVELSLCCVEMSCVVVLCCVLCCVELR